MRSIDELLHYMRVVAGCDDEWSRTFARSILRHSKRPSWRPSPKQTAMMERLASEMFTSADDVIEAP